MAQSGWIKFNTFSNEDIVTQDVLYQTVAQNIKGLYNVPLMIHSKCDPGHSGIN